MGKHKYHHKDLRNLLIKAAILILEEDGLESLTMRTMGKRVGVSRSAPYRHFQDKAALLGAVAADGFGSMRDALVEAAEGTDDPLDLFRTSCRAYVRFAMDRPEMHRLMFSIDLTDEESVEELPAAARAAFSFFIDVIEECQGSECFVPADPLETVNVTWAMLHGLSVLLIEGTIGITESGSPIHSLLVGGGAEPAGIANSMIENAVDTLVRGFGANRT